MIAFATGTTQVPLITTQVPEITTRNYSHNVVIKWLIADGQRAAAAQGELQHRPPGGSLRDGETGGGHQEPWGRHLYVCE